MTTQTIINGNSAEVLKGFPDNHFDAVVTSPPYNLTGLRGKLNGNSFLWHNKGVNVEYDQFDDAMDEHKYQQQQAALIEEFLRVLKPNGSLFYQHKVRLHKGDSLQYHPLQWIMSTSAKMYQEIIWHRRSCVNMQKMMLFPMTERIYWLHKGKPLVFKDAVRHKSDVWSISPEKSTDHPAPFPLELAENCIRLTCQPGMRVLDPYCGSGTTGVAAKIVGCDFVGIDVSAHYCEMARERIERVIA